MNTRTFTFILFLVAALAQGLAQSGPPDNPNRINQLRTLKTVNLTVAKQTIKAWIMDDESKRQEGMMFLKPGDVKESQGMIFLFRETQPAKNSFWMHNCPAGLDIIYIGKNHKVVSVGDGPPESDAQVHPKGPYDFVLEVNRGWSKKHSLKAGDLVTIPTSLKAIQ